MLLLQRNEDKIQEFLKIIEKSKMFSGIDILELSTILDCLGAIKSEYYKKEIIFLELETKFQLWV